MLLVRALGRRGRVSFFALGTLKHIYKKIIHICKDEQNLLLFHIAFLGYFTQQ